MKEENGKPTNEVAEISSDTLDKLASREEDVRRRGLRLWAEIDSVLLAELGSSV